MIQDINHLSISVAHEYSKSIRFLWKEALLVIAVLAAQRGPSIAGLLTMLFLISLSIYSNRGAMQALTICVLLMYLNPNLTSPQPAMTVMKWVLLFITCASTLIRNYRPDAVPRWFMPFIFFIVTSGVFAVLTSVMPELSLFKLSTFAVGVIAALGVFQNQSDRDYPLNWLFTVFCTVLCLSLTLLPFSIGYHVGARHLFQGILSHSQSYGVYLAPFTAFLIARLLTGESRSFIDLPLAIVSILSIFATSSRTSVLALFTGLLCAWFTVVIYRKDLINVLLKKRSVIAQAITLFVLMITMIIFSASAKEHIWRFFVNKGDPSASSSQTISKSFELSRGALIDKSMINFRKYPFTGVGFGMSSDTGVKNVVKDPYSGLPISAPVELGFFPTATLSQIGLIGSLLLLVFLVILFGPILKNTSIPVIALFWCAFLVNIGEMIFYSTGGIGLQMWLIFGFCYAESQRAEIYFRIHSL